MSASQASLVTSGGVPIQLSHLEKVFFPAEGPRKGDLVDYYRLVASRMLPYLRDRPVVLARYPDGVTGEQILQKSVPRHFPDWIRRVEVARGGAVGQVVCDKPATLLYLSTWRTKPASSLICGSAVSLRSTGPTPAFARCESGRRP